MMNSVSTMNCDSFSTLTCCKSQSSLDIDLRIICRDPRPQRRNDEQRMERYPAANVTDKERTVDLTERDEAAPDEIDGHSEVGLRFPAEELGSIATP